MDDDAPRMNPLQVALELANARMREQQAHVEALEKLLEATVARADKLESMLAQLAGIEAVPAAGNGNAAPAA